MYILRFILFTYIPPYTHFVGYNIDEIGMQKDMLGKGKPGAVYQMNG